MPDVFRRTVLVRAWTGRMVLVLLGLLCVGCASSTPALGSAVTTPRSSPTAVPVTATATRAADCSSLTPNNTIPPSVPNIPLPPNTVSGDPNGAAGAAFYEECTMGATQASITDFLNAALPSAGWQAWNPQTEDAHGCGTEPNDFWQWSKGDTTGGVAVGWNVYTSAPPDQGGPPFWLLAFCALAYGSGS